MLQIRPRLPNRGSDTDNHPPLPAETNNGHGFDRTFVFIVVVVVDTEILTGFK